MCALAGGLGAKLWAVGIIFRYQHHQYPTGLSDKGHHRPPSYGRSDGEGSEPDSGGHGCLGIVFHVDLDDVISVDQ